MCLDSIYECLYVQHMVVPKSFRPLLSLPRIPACSRKKKVKKVSKCLISISISHFVAPKTHPKQAG